MDMDEVKLFSVITLSVCVAFGFVLYTYAMSRTKLVEKYIPHFHRGDCFEFDDAKEWWERNVPDGIVEQVGQNKYLVIFREAAEKNGGTKKGSTLSITTFDMFHHKVDCPETWIKHSSSVKKP